MTQAESGKQRGRPFVSGNPGRPPGSRNRSSLFAESLLAEERVNLVRKAVSLALAGNVEMLKFLLGRLLPRNRLLKIELHPIHTSHDAVAALGDVLRAVTEGTITPDEAASVASLIETTVNSTQAKQPARSAAALADFFQDGESIR